MFDQRAFTPGPGHVPESVKLASIRGIGHHRSPEFKVLFRRLRDGLQYIFQTRGDVLMVPASGTGAMQAVVDNLVRPDDRVLVLSGGKYGARWAELCRGHATSVETLTVQPGHAFKPEQVAEAVRQRQPRYLFLTHCETSTGAVNDLEGIARSVLGTGVRMIVDAMTTVGVDPVLMDDWGLDVVVSSSQKGFMCPPGLAFVALSDRICEGLQPANGYSYWDFRHLRESADQLTTPNTPPFTLLFALDEALRLMRQEGLEAIWRRHATVAGACRAGIRATGLPLFAKDRPAAALTAAVLPFGISPVALQRHLLEHFGLLIATGQGPLSSQIIRLGHIGAVSPVDIIGLLAALELTLGHFGHPVEAGAAGQAALTFLLRQQGMTPAPSQCDHPVVAPGVLN